MSDGMRPLGRDGAARTVLARALARTTATLHRYEILLVVIAFVVVVVRVAGGGFLATSPVDDDQVFEVAPLAGDEPTQEIVAVERPAAGLSAMPPSAFPTYAFGPVPVVADAPAPLPDDNKKKEKKGEGQEPPDEFLGDVFPFTQVPEPGAPAGLAVGPTGEVWVGTDNGDGRGGAGAPKVFVFSPMGALDRTYTLPGVNGGITALRLMQDGGLFVLSRSPAAVFRFDPVGGATQTYATIPDVLPCVPPLVVTQCDGSVTNRPPLPMSMAFDAEGRLFVADAAQGAIWRIPLGGGTPQQWLVQRSWTHPTQPAGPTGLAFDGAGKLAVAVRGLLTEDVGEVHLVPVRADGAAGTPTRLARTGAGARPVGLALGTSGNVYVTLAGAGRVLVLSPEGTEIERVPLPAGAPLDTPVGVAFRDRSLLVTVQAPATSTGGRVVRMPVGEVGGRLHG